MAWVTVAVTSLVAIGFLIPLGLLVQQRAEDRALAGAHRQAAVVAAVLAVTTAPEAVQRAAAGGSADPSRVAVHGLAGETLGTGRASAQDVAAAGGQRRPMVVDVAAGRSYLEPVDTGGATVVVEVFVPADALVQGVRRAWYTLLAVAAGLVVAALLVGTRLAARVVEAMHTLARAAVAVGDGNLEMRVRPAGPREVAEAGLAFNRMADRLVAARIAEREQVADLSHRLRTPLTVLRLDAETLDTAADAGPGGELDRRRTAQRIRHAIATLEREIDVLIRTTREAARTAAATGSAAAAATVAATGSVEPVTAAPPGPGGRSRAEDPAAPAERCDVSEVVRERMVFWSAVAADQDRPCTVLGAQAAAPVPLARAELAAALDAVLGNVFRYTPQGTALEVAVSRRDGRVAVRVDDAGAGITDPERAMRRGVSDHGSTGLGLDIARRVTQAARGSVSIGRARLGGASVIMLFADADAPPPQASRFGLIGRLAREPGKKLARRQPGSHEPGHRRWPRQRHSAD